MLVRVSFWTFVICSVLLLSGIAVGFPHISLNYLQCWDHSECVTWCQQHPIPTGASWSPFCIGQMCHCVLNGILPQ